LDVAVSHFPQPFIGITKSNADIGKAIDLIVICLSDQTVYGSEIVSINRPRTRSDRAGRTLGSIVLVNPDTMFRRVLR
jgi:hypothetical protein